MNIYVCFFLYHLKSVTNDEHIYTYVFNIPIIALKTFSIKKNYIIFFCYIVLLLVSLN